MSLSALFPSIEPPAPQPPALKVYPEPQRDRVTEIVRLLRDDNLPGVAGRGELQTEFERERRRLHQAVELLRNARQKLHEQYERNESEQHRLLIAIREEWSVRRRKLESQLAELALQKAREELADERDVVMNEVHELSAQLESERQRLLETIQSEKEKVLDERERQEVDHQQVVSNLEREQADWEQRRADVQLQLNELQRKLVQAELTIVQDRTEWSGAKRRWDDDRESAERDIRELLEELDTKLDREETEPPPGLGIAA